MGTITECPLQKNCVEKLRRGRELSGRTTDIVGVVSVSVCISTRPSGTFFVPLHRPLLYRFHIDHTSDMDLPLSYLGGHRGSEPTYCERGINTGQNIHAETATGEEITPVLNSVSRSASSHHVATDFFRDQKVKTDSIILPS